jgi:hypothetical protein
VGGAEFGETINLASQVRLQMIVLMSLIVLLLFLIFLVLVMGRERFLRVAGIIIIVFIALIIWLRENPGDVSETLPRLIALIEGYWIPLVVIATIVVFMRRMDWNK